MPLQKWMGGIRLLGQEVSSVHHQANATCQRRTHSPNFWGNHHLNEFIRLFHSLVSCLWRAAEPQFFSPLDGVSVGCNRPCRLPWLLTGCQQCGIPIQVTSPERGMETCSLFHGHQEWRNKRCSILDDVLTAALDRVLVDQKLRGPSTGNLTLPVHSAQFGSYPLALPTQDTCLTMTEVVTSVKVLWGYQGSFVLSCEEEPGSSKNRTSPRPPGTS